MKQKIDINIIKINPENPRTIRKEKFSKLVESIADFPKMLELRPIIVDEKMIVLGGNMRLKACKHLGFKKVWVEKVDGLSDQQKKEFIVKDNIGFGDWEWDLLANEWDSVELEDWGLDVWKNLDDLDEKELDKPKKEKDKCELCGK